MPSTDAVRGSAAASAEKAVNLILDIHDDPAPGEE